MLLIDFKRREDGIGPLRLSVMDGQTVVSEGFLGKALRVSAVVRAFGPSITAGMQTHARDA